MVPPRPIDGFAGVTLMDTSVVDETVTEVVAVVEVPAAFVTISV